MTMKRAKGMCGVICTLFMLTAAACTHHAPAVRGHYTTDFEGMSSAVTTTLEADKGTEAKILLSVPIDVFEMTFEQALTVEYGLKTDETIWARCAWDPCPDPIEAWSTWILNNRDNVAVRLDGSEDALTRALSEAREIGDQSVLLALHGYESRTDTGRWIWLPASFSYSQLDDLVCGFARGYAPPPRCSTTDRFRRLAIVPANGETIFLPATIEQLVSVKDLRVIHEGASFYIELFHTMEFTTETKSLTLVSLESLDQDGFCGVMTSSFGVPEPKCLSFSEIQALQTWQKADGEPWSVGDYAALPFRIAAGVGLAIAMGGAAGAGGGS